ncbi:MAG: endonuclease/exonuclease/phosphatase family protein [Bacteroidales bacterium]|nr:endonuclease/exonuclease/phosphatase family protein [Bacteroidales bacterium]
MIRRLFSFVALSALVLTCTNEKETPSVKEHNLAVEPSLVKIEDEALRNHISAQKVLPFADGRRMCVCLSGGGDSFAVSENAEGDVYNFKFKPQDASSFTLGGVYPASAVLNVSGIDNGKAAACKLSVPASQSASAGSYDQEAFILLAKPESFEALPEKAELGFSPAVAVNGLTLKGVKENVTSVIISAPSKALCGVKEFDLTTGKEVKADGAQDRLCVNFAEALPVGDVDIYFCSWACTFAKDEKISVQVVGQTKTYSASLVAGEEGLAFRKGCLNSFEVDFSEVEGTAFSIRDFALKFTGLLDEWQLNRGRVEAGGQSFDNVNFVPADYSFSLGGSVYDKSKAFGTACLAFEKLLDGGKINDELPAATSADWSKDCYSEADKDGGSLQNSFVYSEFIRNFISRQANSAAGGAWAGYCVYTDKDGKSVDEGTPSVAGQYSGVCCLERSLLILVRAYKYILDNSITSGFAPALAGVGFESDLYGCKPGARVPYSQFYSRTAEAFAGNPNVGVLNLQLKGSGTDIVSVNIKSEGACPADGGVNFINLNCTGNTVALTEAGTSLRLVVSPGSYRFNFTVCDSAHQAMTFSEDCKIIAGSETLISKDYKVDDDLIFFEGFDNFVWGGDYVGGSLAPAWAPDSEKMGITSRADVSGYEDACAHTVYNNPGSGYFQSNTWADASGKTVAESHTVTDSYMRSRCIQDYVYFFRIQERPGYLEVGAASTARGMLRTMNIPNIPTLTHAVLSFDVCLKYGFDDALQFIASNGVHISSLRIDGNEVEVTQDICHFATKDVTMNIPRDLLPAASSDAEAKIWHHVEMNLDNMNNANQLAFSSQSSSKGNHGFYIDNIRIVRNTARKPHTLRVLYWNIQNGMWADQPAKYANFVEWVKKYDPDVCVWCEARSIYEDGTETASSARYFPNNWNVEAKKYGHNYVALGGMRDNYPQEITSKYPIDTKLRIVTTDNPSKPVAHGAAVHEVNVAGRSIYFVTMHTWPQKYAYGVNGDAAREASGANHEGDYYREYEMNYVISHTINDPAYASQKDWLLLGDMNSRSRVDNWFYKYDENSTLFLCQDVVRNKTDMVDIIAESYPGDMVSSTGGNARIDYIYASPSMYGSLDNATILIDDWTIIKKSDVSFYLPSDHRPILADFVY